MRGVFETGIEKLVLFAFILLSLVIAGSYFGVFDKLAGAISKNSGSSKVDIGKSNYPDFIMEFKHSVTKSLNPSFTARAWFSSPPYGWTKIDYDAAWQEVQVNQDFWNGCDNCDVYVRKEIYLPASPEDIVEAKIYVCVDDTLELFLNEMQVGTRTSSGCQWFDIKPYLKKGKNVIAMHCHDNSGQEQCRITQFSIKYKEHKLKITINPKKAIVSPEGTPFIDYIIKLENLEGTPKVLKVYLTKPIQIITDDPKFVISVVDVNDNTTKVVLYLNPKETKEFKFRYLNPYKALDLNVLKLPIKIEDEQENVIYNDNLELYSSSNVVKYYQIIDKTSNVGIACNKKLEFVKVLEPVGEQTVKNGQFANWQYDTCRGCCWGYYHKDVSTEIPINKVVKTIKVDVYAWRECGGDMVDYVRIKVYDKNGNIIKQQSLSKNYGGWVTNTIDIGTPRYVSKIRLEAGLYYGGCCGSKVAFRNLKVYAYKSKVENVDPTTLAFVDNLASVKVQCDNNIYSAKLIDNGDIVEVDFSDIPCVNFVEDTYKPYQLIINEQPKTIWIYADNDHSNKLLWEKWEALKQEVSRG